MESVALPFVLPLLSLLSAAWAQDEPARALPEALPSAREARAELLQNDVRGGRWLGVGSTMGLHGLSGVQVGVRVLGVLNPVVTFSPIGTMDLTLRANLLPGRWAPQIGAGYVAGYPYDLASGNFRDRCGLMHFDAGFEFTPDAAFSLNGGLTVGDMDCHQPVWVLPLPYIGVSWYLGR